MDRRCELLQIATGLHLDPVASRYRRKCDLSELCRLAKRRRVQGRLHQSGFSIKVAALPGRLDRLAASVSQNGGRRSLCRLKFSNAPQSVMTSDRGGALALPSVILRCALLRASKDEHGPRPILRGSLRSHLRMT